MGFGITITTVRIYGSSGDTVEWERSGRGRGGVGDISACRDVLEFGEDRCPVMARRGEAEAGVADAAAEDIVLTQGDDVVCEVVGVVGGEEAAVARGTEALRDSAS